MGLKVGGKVCLVVVDIFVGRGGAKRWGGWIFMGRS